MTVDKMTVDKMTVNKMTFYKMTVNKMTVNKMTVDKMTVGIMTFHNLNRKIYIYFNHKQKQLINDVPFLFYYLTLNLLNNSIIHVNFKFKIK